MWLVVLLPILFLSLFLSLVFDLASKKEKWEVEGSSSFECGYSSYFFSRFSFSVHYYVIGLIFLFLDLELCLLMPFFLECLWSIKSLTVFYAMLGSLLLGLLEEWWEGKLEWLN